MPTTIKGYGSPTLLRKSALAAWSTSTGGSGTALASGITELSGGLTLPNQDGEARLLFMGTSDSTALTLGSGWSSVLSSTINGSGRFQVCVSKVVKASASAAGNVTTGATWATSGGAYLPVTVAGTDADVAILATSSVGNSTTMTAPAAATLTRKAHVLRVFFASGTTAPTPGAPSSYGGDGYLGGSTTVGTDYSYMIVDDGEYYSGQTPAAITASLASAKNWIGVTLVIAARSDNRPVVVADGGISGGNFSGSLVSNPFSLCVAQTGTATSDMGKIRAGDVFYLFGFENNNGNYSATPPTGHTLLAGPWTGADRAYTGQGVVYRYEATGPTAPANVTYSASGINYYMGLYAVCVRGADDTNPDDASGTQYAAATTQTVPSLTADRAGALGLTFTVAGGNRQDPSPSFTNSSTATRITTANFSTTANNSDVRIELIRHDGITAGTWTPATSTQTVNNPRPYLGISVIVQAPPPLFTFQAAVDVINVTVLGENFTFELGFGFQADVTVPVTVAVTANFAAYRTRPKPRREFIWVYDLNGNQVDVIT